MYFRYKYDRNNLIFPAHARSKGACIRHKNKNKNKYKIKTPIKRFDISRAVHFPPSTPLNPSPSRAPHRCCTRLDREGDDRRRRREKSSSSSSSSSNGDGEREGVDFG